MSRRLDAGDDRISADARGLSAEVTGLSTVVRVTHADADKDTLILEGAAGTDDVSVGAGLVGLIQVSVQ